MPQLKLLYLKNTRISFYKRPSSGPNTETFLNLQKILTLKVSLEFLNFSFSQDIVGKLFYSLVCLNIININIIFHFCIKIITLLAKINWPHGNKFIENQRKYIVTFMFKKLTYW